MGCFSIHHLSVETCVLKEGIIFVANFMLPCEWREDKYYLGQTVDFSLIPCVNTPGLSSLGNLISNCTCKRSVIRLIIFLCACIG